MIPQRYFVSELTLNLEPLHGPEGIAQGLVPVPLRIACPRPHLADLACPLGVAFSDGDEVLVAFVFCHAILLSLP